VSNLSVARNETAASINEAYITQDLLTPDETKDFIPIRKKHG